MPVPSLAVAELGEGSEVTAARHACTISFVKASTDRFWRGVPSHAAGRWSSGDGSFACRRTSSRRCHAICHASHWSAVRRASLCSCIPATPGCGTSRLVRSHGLVSDAFRGGDATAKSLRDVGEQCANGVRAPSLDAGGCLVRSDMVLPARVMPRRCAASFELG